MTGSFISLDRVSLTYPGGVHALGDISFDLQRGEFVALVGPSGSGKSSLLRLIGGLLAPTSGQILLNTQPVRRPYPQVGYVFQDPVLLPWRTVLANVALPLEILHSPRKKREAQALQMLERVGLVDFAYALPHTLSGGMQQKVAIARALIHDPALLLLDEPFSALDTISREMLNLELLRIWTTSQSTILFVTHLISEAVLLADRIIVLGPRPGKVAGTVAVSLPRPRSLATLEHPDYIRLAAQVRTLLMTAMEAHHAA